jgi:hypothetical protein
MRTVAALAFVGFFTNTAFAITHQLPQPRPTQTTSSLPAFSSINVKGFVDVMIKGEPSSHPKDTAVVNRNPQWLSAKVRHHILYLRPIQAARNHHKAPQITVRMYRLNKLDAHGPVSIVGKNIQSNGLYLRTDSSRDITLMGKMALKSINNTGAGTINMRGVTARSISIRSSAGNITLAGTADEAHIKLFHNAQLHSQFLRTKSIFVRTQASSTATVLPIDSLHAFASDNSHVYYGRKPKTMSRYTSHSGSVLLLNPQEQQ